MSEPSPPVTIWLALVLAAACAAPTPAPSKALSAAASGATSASRPVGFEPGKPFSLRAGEVAQTPDGAWRVGFEAVSSDSRCPKGERCVWAGDATVRIWVQKGSGTRQAGELHAVSGDAQAMRLGAHELRLVRLDPHPIAGKALTKSDYVATLTLERGKAGEAER
jgi:hypothetical protein